jgi:hypothetical protein
MGPFKGVRRLLKWAGVAITVAAINQEMSKPEAQRTWHGKVFGMVPYDFRPPTWDRLREAYWNSSSDRLLTDRPLGIGWAVNFFRAKQLLQAGFGSLMGGNVPAPVREYSRRAQGAVSSLAGDGGSSSGGNVKVVTKN